MISRLVPTRLLAGGTIALVLMAGHVTAGDAKPNVLFIAVDDLRPQLGCYGRSFMHTPNIDRLARSGTMFRRAYCMVPTCGASRASLMTGLRPSRHRFVSYRTWAEKDAPGVTPLHTHFRNHGYHTVSLGKVLHHPEDHREGWSEDPWRPDQRYLAYQNLDSVEQWKRHRKKHDGKGRARGPAYEAAEVPDDAYPDGKLAKEAIERLGRIGDREEPFFLAVGFFRPHLPFMAPEKYWERYDHEEIHLPANYHPPRNVPNAAMHNFGELRAYAGIPHSGPVPTETARKMIHGYYAAVSYVDAQVGRVLDALERKGLREETLVVLWGDHGWQLGEHGLWCKHCTFETSMQAPLIVRAPGLDGGQQTRGLTEFIDIYPSLCELAGLPRPDHLQGRSFVPLLKDPTREWKAAAVGRFRNGDTVRTDRYRYSEYTRGSGEVVARMLYDHRTDPRENVNIAGRETRTEDVERLSSLLNRRKGKDRELSDTQGGGEE